MAIADITAPALRLLYRELATFGVVGAICLVSDVALFNLLAFVVGLTPVLAKSIGLLITGLMAFFGHRHVTFRHRHGGSYRREVSLFLASTAVTVILSLVPVYLARHVGGVTSVVGLNVANLVGIVLGTFARYLAYRYLVWAHLLPVQSADGPAADPQRRETSPAPVSGGRVSVAGPGLPGDDAGRWSLLQLQDELVGE